MILTRRSLVTLAALCLAAALLQVAFFAGLRVFGATPEFSLLVVVAIGLLAGSLTGTVFGFSLGLLIDCLLMRSMGATALALMAVGYLAGRYREDVGRPTRGAVPLLGGGLTLVGLLAFAVTRIGLGVDAEVSAGSIALEILVQTMIGAALMPPVLWLSRKLLGPALVEDAPRRRRRRRPGRESVAGEQSDQAEAEV